LQLGFFEWTVKRDVFNTQLKSLLVTTQSIRVIAAWIPAFPGMTDWENGIETRVILAKAGIQYPIEAPPRIVLGSYAC
jgi:hypothetical protein